MCADSKHNEHRVILKYQILQWTCFLGKVSCTGNLPSQKWNEMRKMEPYASECLSLRSERNRKRPLFLSIPHKQS